MLYVALWVFASAVFLLGYLCGFRMGRASVDTDERDQMLIELGREAGWLEGARQSSEHRIIARELHDYIAEARAN